jgi:hypothetical protein
MCHTTETINREKGLFNKHMGSPLNALRYIISTVLALVRQTLSSDPMAICCRPRTFQVRGAELKVRVATRRIIIVDLSIVFVFGPIAQAFQAPRATQPFMKKGSKSIDTSRVAYQNTILLVNPTVNTHYWHVSLRESWPGGMTGGRRVSSKKFKRKAIARGEVTKGKSMCETQKPSEGEREQRRRKNLWSRLVLKSQSLDIPKSYPIDPFSGVRVDRKFPI